MALRKQLLLFAISGAIGFIVDAGIVQFLVREWLVNAYAARVASFLAAATTTWTFNRRYTFAGRGDGNKRRELFRYLFAMACGFALNYGAYATCLALWPLVHRWPVIGVAVGSVAGAALNFLTSKYWIFRRPKGTSAAPADGPDGEPARLR